MRSGGPMDSANDNAAILVTIITFDVPLMQAENLYP
jgi:hypothetical protein